MRFTSLAAESNCELERPPVCGQHVSYSVKHDKENIKVRKYQAEWIPNATVVSNYLVFNKINSNF